MLLVTADPECVVAVRTADCVPLLLAHPAGPAVAAVHAGWRGVVAGVIERAVPSSSAGRLEAVQKSCAARLGRP